MGWQVLQSVRVDNAGGTGLTITTPAWPNNLSASSKLIAYFAMDTSTGLTSIKDSNNNTFSQIANVTGSADLSFIHVLDTPIADAGSKPTITVTMSGTQNGSGILVQEVLGLVPGTACIDGIAGTANGAPTTNFTSSWGSCTSATTQEFLVGYYADNGDTSGTSNAGPAGYTADPNNTAANNSNASNRVYYKNSTGGAETIAGLSVTTGGTTGWCSIFLAFKLARTAQPMGPRTGSWA